MSIFNIRLAKKSDFGYITECLGLNDGIKVKNIFDKCLQNPNCHPLFIAEVDGKKKGIACCNVIHTLEMGCETLSISNLVVNKEDRGKGIGTKFIKSLCDYAKENDISALEVITPPPTDDMFKEKIKFFEKLGFFDVGPGYFNYFDKEVCRYE